MPRLLETSEIFRRSWARQGDNYRIEALKAAIALAPAPPVRSLVPSSLRFSDCATKIIAAAQDQEAPLDVGARWLKRQNPRFELEVLDGQAGHYTFLAEGTDRMKAEMPNIFCDLPGVDRRIFHEQVVASVLEFLERTVTASSP